MNWFGVVDFRPFSIARSYNGLGAAIFLKKMSNGSRWRQKTCYFRSLSVNLEQL